MAGWNPIEVLTYVIAAVLLLSFLMAREKRWRKLSQAAVAELKEKLFPQLIENLKTLDRKLSEEEIGGEVYVELLDKGWKSTLALDFHRYYGREEEIFTNLKQDLEEYAMEARELKETDDKRLKERAAKSRARLRENLAKLVKRLEEIR